MTIQQVRPRHLSRQLSPVERDYYGELVAHLASARQAQGISQAALDDRVGVSEGLVAKWESKARLPGAFYLMCWCEALGVKLTIREVR